MNESRKKGIGFIAYLVITVIIDLLFIAWMITALFGALFTYSAQRREMYILAGWPVLILFVIYNGFFIWRCIRRKKKTS